jgi:hypothetical protein
MRKIFIAIFAAIAALSVFMPGQANASTLCTITSQYGECSYPPVVIDNNMWGEVQGSRQILTATQEGNWAVVATEPNYGGVKTYPEVEQNYDNSVGSLIATQQVFDADMVPAKTVNTAWDVIADDWINGTPNSPSPAMIELAVFEDYHNTQPAGYNTGKSITIAGQKFDLWVGTGSTDGSEIISLASTTSVTKGTIHLVDILHWLSSLNYVSPADTLRQLGFGVEVISTNSQPEKFHFAFYHNNVLGSICCAT